MDAGAEIHSGPWIIFIAAVMVFLALDLGVFHRRARQVRFREALLWTGIWYAIAMLFAFAIAPLMIPSWKQNHTEEFITGYIIELSLSMDNVFVIALIFAYFDVPKRYQHRVLFWGILGALVMRAGMIFLGVALVRKFSWMFYLLGVFLIYTGIRMVFAGQEKIEPEKNLAIRLTRRFFPVSSSFDGQNFTTKLNGRVALTPLALVLVMVETTDLIFAVDSIPAIFAVTQNEFIIFTSNVFAILGLRSLYFVLAGALGFFRYLKVGLSLVLVFVGVKMLGSQLGYHIHTRVSLAIVGGIILLSIILSLLAGKKRKEPTEPPH